MAACCFGRPRRLLGAHAQPGGMDLCECMRQQSRMRMHHAKALQQASCCSPTLEHAQAVYHPAEAQPFGMNAVNTAWGPDAPPGSRA
eukprot:357075-Chlamydomonas_euryale.AAC.1